jgi:hypothetical protein
MMSATSPAIAALVSAGVAVAGCASDPRAGFERVQVGDSWASVERLMGRPETTIWEYQATDQVFVKFEDGLVTGLYMRLPKDDPRSTKGDFRPPVDLGMTQGQVEAILGSPTEPAPATRTVPSFGGRFASPKAAPSSPSRLSTWSRRHRSCIRSRHCEPNARHAFARSGGPPLKVFLDLLRTQDSIARRHIAGVAARPSAAWHRRHTTTPMRRDDLPSQAQDVQYGRETHGDE